MHLCQGSQFLIGKRRGDEREQVYIAASRLKVAIDKRAIEINANQFRRKDRLPAPTTAPAGGSRQGMR